MPSGQRCCYIVTVFYIKWDHMVYFLSESCIPLSPGSNSCNTEVIAPYDVRITTMVTNRNMNETLPVKVLPTDALTQDGADHDKLVLTQVGFEPTTSKPII